MEEDQIIRNEKDLLLETASVKILNLLSGSSLLEAKMVLSLIEDKLTTYAIITAVPV